MDTLIDQMDQKFIKTQQILCKTLAKHMNKTFIKTRQISYKILAKHMNIESNRINKHYIAISQIRIRKPIPILSTDFNTIPICSDEEDIKNIMIVDVETTGGYGPLIQIAYNIYDSKFNCIKRFDCLINENIGRVDWFKKYTIHEIRKNGRKPRDAFTEIGNDLATCSHVVGHNLVFDMNMLDIYF